jgi:hypothetical protein
LHPVLPSDVEIPGVARDELAVDVAGYDQGMGDEKPAENSVPQGGSRQIPHHFGRSDGADHDHCGELGRGHVVAQNIVDGEPDKKRGRSDRPDRRGAWAQIAQSRDRDQWNQGHREHERPKQQGLGGRPSLGLKGRVKKIERGALRHADHTARDGKWDACQSIFCGHGGEDTCSAILPQWNSRAGSRPGSLRLFVGVDHTARIVLGRREQHLGSHGAELLDVIALDVVAAGTKAGQAGPAEHHCGVASPASTMMVSTSPAGVRHG